MADNTAPLSITEYRSMHFRDIHKGDVIYESVSQMSVEVLVLTDPMQYEDQWRFTGETAFGTIPYLMTEQYPHYGPQLTRKPTRPIVKHLATPPAPTVREQPEHDPAFLLAVIEKCAQLAARGEINDQQRQYRAECRAALLRQTCGEGKT